MSRSRLPSLLLLAAALASPLHGLETFQPEPVTWAKAPEGFGYARTFVLGSTWAAYRDSPDEVKLADRATGQILKTFGTPAADTPVEGVPGQWRTVSGGGQILMHGSKLAIVSSGSISNSPPGYSGTTRSIIHVQLFDLPSGAPAGILDVELNAYYPFCALSSSRLVVLDQQNRSFLQWDPVTLAALPTVTVPAELPAPMNYATYGARHSMAMGEDTVAFIKDGFEEQLDVVAANLATGVVARLPIPTGRVLNGRKALAARNDALLVASGTSTSYNETNGKLDLLHYDLTTRTLVGDTSLTHGTGVNEVRVVVQPDGGWRVLAGAGGGGAGFHLASGHDLKSTCDGAVTIPDTLGLATDTVAGAIGSEIWFKPRSSDLPGLRAVKLSAGTAASTIVTATALHCAESDGELKVKLTCSPAPTSPLSLRIRTKDGTATAGSDFTAVDRIETVPAGQAETIVTIPITQDTQLEATEHFQVELSDASPSAVLPEREVNAVIRATSLDLLPPVATYQTVPASKPHRVHLANGLLLQFNERLESSSAPKLARKPFDGGDWLPSPNWDRNLVSRQSAELFGRSGNLALFRENDEWADHPEYTLYDVPNDQVIFRVKPTGHYPAPRAAIGTSRFFCDPGSSAPYREYDLTAPHASRTIARTSGGPTIRGAAYTRDFLAILSDTKIEKYSLVDGSYLGVLLPSGPWVQDPVMIADNDLLAIRDGNALWLLDIDEPEKVKRVKATGAGFGSYLEFADGLLYSCNASGPSVTVIDPRSGLLLDTIKEDFEATVPEGWAGLGEYMSIYAPSFSAEGKKAAILAYEGDNNNGTYRVLRLSREGQLPSLRNPEPIREGDGSLSLQLAEAAPFPITVTTRTVTTVHNQQEDWSGVGSAVIPAGQTSFATGLNVVDDHISEGDRNVALEITLTGNGHTEVRRLPLRTLDNDRFAQADVPQEKMPFDYIFASVSGAWAHRSSIEGFSWTGNPDFYAATPYGWEANYEFPLNMTGSGEWLAVTHGTWGGNFDTKYPSSVFLYKPASGNRPVKILKGMKRDNYFGSGLFARGNKLWVGAPGRYDTNGKKVIDVKGQAFEYDMATGKRTRTFKPQKQFARGFGSRIVANDTSVWFTSYDYVAKIGSVSQYSRSTGKWVRTLTDPIPGSEIGFGGQLEANADTLIVTNAGKVRGYSAATGTLAWTLEPPNDYPINTFELIRDDLLVVGTNTLFFYQLIPGQQPVMLVELTSNDWGVSKLEANRHTLLVYRDSFNSSGVATLLDLRGIPHLSSFFPPAPAPLAAETAPKIQQDPPKGINFTKDADGWLMSFGADVALGTIPGKILTLESSTDLDEWETVAQRDASAGWVPVVEWLSTGEGNSLKIKRDDTARYFRLRLEPENP